MPDAGGSPGIYSARPVITVDNTTQPALAQQLQSLFVEETVAGLYRCEATFVNWGPRDGSVGFLYFDRAVLEFGKDIKVEIGAGTGRGTVFEGRIMALEGRFTNARPPELLILAEDRLQDLRMTRRTRVFENITDADVIRQIASAHGLTPDISASGPTHKVIAQVNQSDLALARERALAIGAELWVEGSSLKLKPRTARSSAQLALTFGQGLREFAVTADLADQTSSFTVAGWDVASKQAVSHRASNSVIANEVGNGEAGATILDAALATRDQQVVHALAATQSEAQALAEALYARTARKFVVGTGIAEGDARIRVGSEVELKEVGPLFQGMYRVTRVRHTFDLTDGFRTEFSVERAALGRAA